MVIYVVNWLAGVKLANSASVVELVTKVCFLVFQSTRLLAKKTTYTPVEYCNNKSLVKLVLAKVRNLRSLSGNLPLKKRPS